jgi:ABC-2 type transport system ATP-binding protein
VVLRYGAWEVEPMGSSVIVVENLTKYYGKARGVESIGFAVEPGEVFGFLGPNGAGKTTTIRILLDLVRPTSGTVSVFGTRVAKDSLGIRRRCGYLPGDFFPYGQFTADEFLRFASHLRKRDAPVAKSLLDRFGFSKPDLSRKIKHLSHGTRQKLGIVQAFFHEPELLILDEPTNGLDPLMQGEFYRLLGETKREGRTVFLSSHILPEVEKVCDRVAIVRAGTLVALETLEALKKKRYRRLTLRLRERLEKVELTGAELVKTDGVDYEFLVKGGAGAFLGELARLPVEDFVFPEPDLEEVFMTYYRER